MSVFPTAIRCACTVIAAKICILYIRRQIAIAILLRGEFYVGRIAAAWTVILCGAASKYIFYLAGMWVYFRVMQSRGRGCLCKGRGTVGSAGCFSTCKQKNAGKLPGAGVTAFPRICPALMSGDPCFISLMLDLAHGSCLPCAVVLVVIIVIIVIIAGDQNL